VGLRLYQGRFTRQRIAGLWTLEPSPLDQQNALDSHCALWMVTYTLATTKPWVLKWLVQVAQMKVVVRLEEHQVGMVPTYDTPQKRDHVMVALVEAFASQGLGMDKCEAFICGVEPENQQKLGEEWKPLKFTWGEDWRLDLAFTHAWQIAQFIGVWKAHPTLRDVPFITPGWTIRVGLQSEDAPPEPGLNSWAEATRWAYNQADGNGDHCYMFNMDSQVDKDRVKWGSLKFQQMLRHKNIWMDELGVPEGPEINGKDDVYQMGAYIEIFKVLENPRLFYGERVVLAVPFTANGTGIGWDPSLLIQDPRAWQMLGRYIQGLG
jgi:hypothetical protein